MLEEVLADRCQVLSAKTLLLLKLVLAVSKAAALLFLAVFAVLALEPEAAQLSLDLLLPAVLVADYLRVGHSHVRILAVKALIRRVTAIFEAFDAVLVI